MRKKLAFSKLPKPKIKDSSFSKLPKPETLIRTVAVSALIVVATGLAVFCFLLSFTQPDANGEKC